MGWSARFVWDCQYGSTEVDQQWCYEHLRHVSTRSHHKIISLFPFTIWHLMCDILLSHLTYFYNFYKITPIWSHVINLWKAERLETARQSNKWLPVFALEKGIWSLDWDVAQTKDQELQPAVLTNRSANLFHVYISAAAEKYDERMIFCSFLHPDSRDLH